ncbi:hypothetical protein PIB30_071156 [Stylosanthes scabra]|uniref:Uncharacterized protein n=1 Tax=Stylosanthes scabra TaxID=79078 RepID=A0ABU6VMP2_9FABA|nr:hypothetical protein [Stylosanthes scabra]
MGALVKGMEATIQFILEESLEPLEEVLIITNEPLLLKWQDQEPRRSWKHVFDRNAFKNLLMDFGELKLSFREKKNFPFKKIWEEIINMDIDFVVVRNYYTTPTW